MSILRVDTVISRFEESEVEILGLRVGEYPIEMNPATENFVADGTCIYQNDKFQFKQNGIWIEFPSNGLGVPSLHQVVQVGAATSFSITVGGLNSSGDITTAGKLYAKSVVITDYGVEFPDGTVQTTACDCIDLLGDIPNVSVPESSGDIEENSYLYFNHTLNLWIPHVPTTTDLADICACPEYEVGDALIWNGTCWEAQAVPGLTPCVFNLEGNTGSTLELECGDTIKIIGGSAAISTWTSSGAGGEDQIEIAWEAGLNMLFYGDGEGGESGNVRSDLSAEAGDIFQWDATGFGHWDAIGAPGGGLSVGDVLAWDGDHWIGASPTGSVGLENIVEDLTPQLGADLDVNGNDIISTPGTDGDIVISPSGTGHVILSQLIYPRLDGTAGQYITTNGAEVLSWADLPAGGGADNLGNHIATENLQMSDFWLSNDGTDHGIYIKSDGNVGINTGVGIEPGTSLVVDGGTSIDDSSNPSGYINIGDSSAEHMSIDLMGIQTKIDSDTVNDLHLQPLGGHVGVGVALVDDTKQTIDIENKGGFHANQFESQDPPALNATQWVAAVDKGDFRSYKVFLTVVDKTIVGGVELNEYMSTTVVVLHDGTDVYHSEYGRIEVNPNSADPLNDPLTNGFSFESDMVLDAVTLTIQIDGTGNMFEGTAIITALQGDL